MDQLTTHRLAPPVLRAPPLTRGATVGVFAPSLPLATVFRDRFAFSVEQLGRSLDVVPVLADNVIQATGGFCAGSGAERARQFNAWLDDEAIEAIFCAIGGFNSAEMLPLIDMALAKRKPKILVGYSDATALLLGMQAAAGWMTFHGPAVMTQFGEYPRIFEYTLRSLQRALRGQLRGALDPPAFWTNERLEWGDGSWRKRERRPAGPGTFQAWREGEGEGALWGGNLETVNMLAGTPYFAPPPGPIVLFWEAVEAEAYLPRVRRALTHLAQCGILDRTTAMLVGRSPDAADCMGVTLRETVLAMVAPYGFPVLAELPIGHTDPLATLPIGVRVRVLSGVALPAIEFLEEAVAPIGSSWTRSQ